MSERDARFLDDAAKHFDGLPDGGEDRACWANRYNAENCRRIAAAIRTIDDGATALQAGIVIARIAEAAQTIAYHAGVGGMETAGSIVSYLNEHPDDLAKLVDGTLSVIDWPDRWHMHGCLSWHGQDGRVFTPQFARRQNAIREMQKGPSA